MMLNDDYKDLLRAFIDERVKFMIVGAYAVAAHGHVRATMDIDLWVEPSRANAAAVLRALEAYGAPLHDLTEDDLRRDDTIFQIGVIPRRIDVITGVSGLRFSEAYSRAPAITLDGIEVHVLSLDDLIRNKRATGRLQDLADVEALERGRPDEDD